MNIDHEAARDCANEAVEFYANNLLANGYRLSNAEQRDYLVSTAYLDLQQQVAAERRKNGPECPVCDMPMYIEVQPSMGDVGPETQETWHCAHCQLAAERARVEALAGLVKSAYDNGFIQGMRESTTNLGGKPWNESRAAKQLTAILNAQGDTNA